MQSRRHAIAAVGAVTLLILTGCAGDPDPDANGDETPVISAPPPTLPPSDEPEEPELPEFEDVDTSGWDVLQTQDGRGALSVPPNWYWERYYEFVQGVPDGQFRDEITISLDNQEKLVFEDVVSPPEQCSDDGEGEVLDLAELPASSDYSLVALALPDGEEVQFAAGIIESDRVEELGCGVSFFTTNQDLQFRFSTAPTLPSSSLDDNWKFDSVDAARSYLQGEEYQNIRASLLSFQPPA